MQPVKQLLITLVLLGALSTQAADFTDADRKHFENQCKDLMSDVMVTLAKKHPNPKTSKGFDVINLFAAATNPLQLFQTIFAAAEVATYRRVDSILSKSEKTA